MMKSPDAVLSAEMPRMRLALLLEEFRGINDDRDPGRVAYPLAEVLFLLTCATIAGCDDFEEIVAWGNAHLEFLRGFSEYYFGIPCERWLRCLVNRIDPGLFAPCFEDWIAALWPKEHAVIAIDGKTSRRSHDRSKSRAALHTLSAYATGARLVLTQRFVAEKTNEITAIPEVIGHLAATGQLKGSTITIDAMGCQSAIAKAITDHDAHYLLALKGNHPNFEAGVASYFDSAPQTELVSLTHVEKGHGRIETRIHTASGTVDWVKGPKNDPAEPNFAKLKTLLKIVNRIEYKDRRTTETRYFISSLPLDIERLATAARAHWGIESMHWILDVAFKDDLSRTRAGHGAKNMAILRRFALNLVRAANRKGSVKTKRKAAGWDTRVLREILQLT